MGPAPVTYPPDITQKVSAKATLVYGVGDVRIEEVPDPVIQAPTDAIVRVERAAICGSDLHPYRSMPTAE